MRKIIFTVLGSPVAQPRVKARHIKTHDGREFTSVYNPQGKSRQWKSDVRQEAIKHMPETLLRGPVEISIDFYLPRPKKFYRKMDAEGPMPHVSKPDRDNLDKAILDALKGIAFVDDCQVCGGEVRKFYHEKDGRPRAEIRIEEVAGSTPAPATTMLTEVS